MSLHCSVVGYGTGVGAAVARAFAREGMALTLIARDAAKVEAAAAAMGNAAGFAADAGDEAALTAALAAATARFGAPDVLIYNAAKWRPGPVLAHGAADLLADLAIGVAGALTAARAVAPAMQARGKGSILFTGGGFALYPSPAAPSLSIQKAGIRALARMLAQELAPSGVRVGTVTILGTVAPGTKFDPGAIAEAFLTLHRGAPDAATAEIQFA